MSSKILHFKQTANSTKQKILNDLDEIRDISFDTIIETASLNSDIQLMTSKESIIQSLKNLMSLPVGGNVLFPTRGERVGDMLFAPGLFPDEAKKYLISYLNSNEHRILINDVTCTKEINDFNEQIVTLNVSYSFRNSEEIYNISIDLKSSLANGD